MLGLVQDPAIGFDLVAIANEVCASEIDMPAAVKAFEKRALPLVATEADRQRTRYAEFYVSLVGRPIATAVFGGLANGNGMVLVKEYLATPDGVAEQPVRVTTAPEGSLGKIVAFCSHAQEFLEGHPRVRGEDATSIVQKTLDFEFRNSRSSGPPASIIRITDNGVRWLQKGACK
jgi:hypothetical protein